jgi:hypothetical protein
VLVELSGYRPIALPEPRTMADLLGSVTRGATA